ncbi:response regulator [Thermosynechococcus sp. HN-54]|uniref:response regulator n=1 Tax=Thermosynechococcus sp. HN-54 TaxID=2933959 RepID=UPI00202D02F9|nr:response regulator [Thermosynechococcus sp. HN-54]URR36073.1 response regulator [Thermosynechococcus sp. HN-54]
MAKITVVLIEDSPVALKVLERLIAGSSEVEIVGTAADGLAGLQLIEQTQPDVICTDLEMAGMGGFEFIEAVQQRFPRPILVISATPEVLQQTHSIAHLKAAGILDFFPKPAAITPDLPELRSTLIRKIQMLARPKSQFHPASPMSSVRICT